MYSPAEVDYTLANGVQAKLTIKTDYPFDDTVTIDASCGKGMILSLRIPSWTYQSSVSVNGTAEDKSPLPGEETIELFIDIKSHRCHIVLGSLFDLFCTWSTEIVLKFPMKITVERRYNDSAAIFRG